MWFKVKKRVKQGWFFVKWCPVLFRVYVVESVKSYVKSKRNK